MKIKIFCTLLSILFFTFLVRGQNTFSVKENKTYLNGKEFQAIGLRCSNALLSDETTNELINQLDIFKSYGLNTISVFFMGSRFSDINGYNRDGTLNDTYKKRMGKIIEACDKKEMVVLVGILYWGKYTSNSNFEYYKNWTQKDVNNAIRNTLLWLKSNDYKNVFIDPDNEGMAEKRAGFNIDEMICEGKKAVPGYVIAYNNKSYPPPCADMTIHFGKKTTTMPYIESEGTPGEYWGSYSKEYGLKNYINIGIYTKGKKEQQLQRTKDLLDKGHGYLFASTWLQCIPPNYDLGGDGTPCNPGITWWCDFIKDRFK
jgi:hypothetical protein